MRFRVVGSFTKIFTDDCNCAAKWLPKNPEQGLHLCQKFIFMVQSQTKIRPILGQKNSCKYFWATFFGDLRQDLKSTKLLLVEIWVEDTKNYGQEVSTIFDLDVLTKANSLPHKCLTDAFYNKTFSRCQEKSHNKKTTRKNCWVAICSEDFLLSKEKGAKPLRIPCYQHHHRALYCTYVPTLT